MLKTRDLKMASSPPRFFLGFFDHEPTYEPHLNPD